MGKSNETWFRCWLLSLVILVLTTIVQSSPPDSRNKNGAKTAVFHSPAIVLEPGSVSNKFYYNIDFPRGHVAVKDFYAEVVDETGKSVPLHETYLHHWVVVRYHQRIGVEVKNHDVNLGFDQSDFIVVGNAGICGSGLTQYFGLGSETRRTDTHVPDPYGIEIGNPLDIPSGFEERWVLNVHAIDTRGVEDRLGCTECRCDLYNVTKDEYDRDLQSDYIGGLRCCHDEMRCRVKKGVQNVKRSLFLKYIVTYVDWHQSIVPVKIYILDVTDTWKKTNESTSSRHHCLIEYDVESCSAGIASDGCIDNKSVSVSFPTGGNVIYGAAHQHTGGVGSTLYGEDGRVICSSNPIYGEGEEPGNEAGYIVGMSTCYPQPGSVKISDGETLTLVSNYRRDRKHTGVMGLFYMLIADSPPRSNSALHAPVKMNENVLVPNAILAVAMLGVAVLVIIVAFQRRSWREYGYESLAR